MSLLSFVLLTAGYILLGMYLLGDDIIHGWSFRSALRKLQKMKKEEILMASIYPITCLVIFIIDHKSG